MAIKIAVLFLPSLIGVLWLDDPGISIIWSLTGSFFIAAIALTSWFRDSDKNDSIARRLLRPVCTFHFFFVVLNVVGAAFYALDTAGYSLSGRVAVASQDDLALNAVAQGLMLLAHASVTAGMRLAGFRYDRPKYVVRSIPPYSLMVLSFLCLMLGTALVSIESLANLSQKILQIASTAVLIELTFAVRRRNLANIAMASLLLFFNLLSQTLSGWKGLTLWTMITLGGLLYPLMPRRVVFGGTAFLLFWALYLHPFGLALRPLIWYQGVDRDTAVAISMDEALNMSLEERVDGVWTLMVGRASELYQFGKYLEYVPAVHSYYGFDLAKEAAIGLVPRIIWPEKPDLERIAMQRVYAADIVSEDAVVSAKGNWYQDAYLSGGWQIVIAACIVFGFAIMLISRACERLFGGYEIGTCLIFTSLFATAMNTPLNFLFAVGTIWTSLLTMVVFLFVGRLTGWLVPIDARPGKPLGPREIARRPAPQMIREHI